MSAGNPDRSSEAEIIESEIGDCPLETGGVEGLLKREGAIRLACRPNITRIEVFFLTAADIALRSSVRLAANLRTIN